MDDQISRWIIEFLLRQRVDDTILDRLLSVLPLNNDDSRLKKALLLRRIQTEVTNGTVSEKILELLELVGELDFIEGKKVPSEAMKAAYCTVAVDCTVRFLGLRDNEKYIETLKKLWRGRVRKMEKSENSGLIYEKLLSWRDDLEAASSDLELCGKILSRNTRNEAFKAVKGYLAESWNEVGPSFIEKTAEDVVEMGKVGRGINETVEEQGLECSENVIIADRPPVEIQQNQGLPRCRNAGGSREVRITNIEEVDIDTSTNIEEVDIDTSTNKYDPIPIAKVNRIKADLLSSFADLRAVVTDPLPEALKMAERVVSDVNRDRGLGGNNGGAMHEVSTSMDKTKQTCVWANRVESVGCSDEHPEGEDCRNGSDPSPTDLLPGSNSDSIEFSEELPRRPALSSPRRSKISPLKKYQMKKLSKRRPPKKWSVLEEDTLRNAVKELGRSWKAILDAHRDIFEERTYVDLKDKWRNMTRYSR